MTMFMANQSATLKNAEYAAAGDFCQIFDQDMSSLYLLSLLLTGDHEKAEQCFVQGLENAVSRNRVFKEWARSWARRVMVQNALRIISPRPNAENGPWGHVSIDGRSKAPSERVEIAAVLGLATFDRFVFVMSVLEGYSDHDCAVLLGCARRDVLAARTRALQQIGSAAEFQQQTDTRSHGQAVHDRRDSSVLEVAV
jgi:DNA-directed RNA polymerase specialized sigma24 family protein